MEYQELVETIAMQCLEGCNLAVADADHVLSKLESIKPADKENFRNKLIKQNIAQDKKKDAELAKKEAETEAA